MNSPGATGSFALRCRCANGDTHNITGIEPNQTIEQLLDRIANVTSIRQASNIRIKQGFPPKALDLSDLTLNVSSLPLQNGDILIVEEVVKSTDQHPAPITAQATLPSYKPPSQLQSMTNRNMTDGKIRGMLLRRIVPADNSCLFSSINFAMNDAAMEEDCVHQMRQLIAATVMSDPDTYSAAMLGKPNNKYCDWILDPESWGGAIEISILSKHYGVEMCVVDTVSGCIQRFGQDYGYRSCIFLIYDGLHYDPLMLEPFTPGNPIQTKFSCNDDTVMQQAIEICEESKVSNSSRIRPNSPSSV